MSPPQFVWLNGRLVPSDQATVSVFDRSFLYGDGLFESIAVREGCLLRWTSHLARLELGAARLGIRIPVDGTGLRDAASQILEANGLRDGTVRIHLSRGIGRRGYSPRGAENPGLVLSTHPAGPGLDELPSWRLRTSSLRVAAGDPIARIKSSSKLLQVLARAEAEEAGDDEALLLNTEGRMLESSSGNLFWMEAGLLHTPPVSDGLLPGVTREAVLRRARQVGLEPRESSAGPDRLLRSQGGFLTLSSLGIVEIASLDGAALPRSPKTRELWEALLRDSGPEGESPS
jgi:branched-subunit amino acid aminotransferase/4-amino-4-deoxychorismate lyase